MNEREDVQTPFLLEASRQGHRLWRNNVGVAKVVDKPGAKPRFVVYGVGGEGGLDTVGFTRDGTYAEVELKAGDNLPSLAQCKRLRMLAKWPVVSGWARSMEEALDVLERKRLPDIEWLDARIAKLEKLEAAKRKKPRA